MLMYATGLILTFYNFLPDYSAFEKLKKLYIPIGYIMGCLWSGQLSWQIVGYLPWYKWLGETVFRILYCTKGVGMWFMNFYKKTLD